MNWEYVNKIQKCCAFMPCYLEGTGKATRLIYKDGTSGFTSWSMDKVINDYFNINMRSISSIKKCCSKITGKRSITPLFIEKDCILLPIKTLKPFTRGDRCFGYVITDYIENIDYVAQAIYLNNGCSITFMDSSETIKKRIADCDIIIKNLNNNESILS